jgi:hypothetical protein
MTLEELSALLDRYDPMALLKIGAPPGEYTHEGDKILASLSSLSLPLTEETVLNVVFDAFDSSFNFGQVIFNNGVQIEDAPLVRLNKDYTGGKEHYRDIAREIVANWRKTNESA